MHLSFFQKSFVQAEASKTLIHASENESEF